MAGGLQIPAIQNFFDFCLRVGFKMFSLYFRGSFVIIARGKVISGGGLLSTAKLILFQTENKRPLCLAHRHDG